MRNITIKWLKQAEADLKAAKDSLEDRNYEWRCFSVPAKRRKGFEGMSL